MSFSGESEEEEAKLSDTDIEVSVSEVKKACLVATAVKSSIKESTLSGNVLLLLLMQ